MEVLWLPISLFGKHVITGLPDYFQTIPMLFFVVYLTYLFVRKKQSFKFSFSSGILLFLLIVLLAQGFATMRTILTFPITGIGVFDKYFQFIYLLLYFVIIYLVLKNNLTEDGKIRKFLNGFFFYGVLIVCLLTIQFVFIHTGALKAVIQFIGATFAQGGYSESINPAYLESTVSYLTKYGKPNGLDPEGRDVAIRLSLIVVPFLLAALKNGYRMVKNKKNESLYLSLLCSIFIMLLAIQTLFSILLGLLTALLTVFIVVLKKTNSKNTFHKEGAIFVGFIGFVFTVFSFFPKGISQLGDSNRTASAIALWRVFSHHFIIGVGYDFSSPYAILYAPAEHTNSVINVQIYLANDQMPALSTGLAWFSQFGLIVILPLFFYVIRTKLDFSILIDRMYEAKLAKEKIKLYQTVDDLFFFLLIFLLPASFLLFDWRGLSYVLVLFFILVVKNFLEKQLNVLAPLKEI
ncbi:MAG: hypothetical protein LBT69_03090 [Lactobacillales bacterium]|jgi:hypothetical protein|nr:hypothetical protein [Lactobacillales bacterium]